MSGFVGDASELLAEPAHRFGLTLVPADASTLLLVGSDYAVLVGSDFDQVIVSFVDTAAPAHPRAYGVTTYVVTQRLTPADSALFGEPTTLSDRLRASLRVLASGLANRCADILSGDRAWLARLRSRDPVRWAGSPPSAVVLDALQKHATLHRASTPGAPTFSSR